jgi:phytoene dehydrogenase-like protein
MVDAIMIGSGLNGRMSANVLADAGWVVLTLETEPDPGGTVRTRQITILSLHHDLFMSFTLSEQSDKGRHW